MTNSVSPAQEVNQATAEPSARCSWRLIVRKRFAAFTSQIMRLPKPLRILLQPLCLIMEGTSLGLLRQNDVQQMVAETYDSDPQFYDPRRYRLRHEERLLPVLKQLTGNADRLLDAFCGQGREAELFAKNGYDVTAIDRVPGMIRKAAEYAAEARFEADFLVADFDTFTPELPFDVMYTSCWMYSTVQERHHRIQFLKRCRELCSEGGLIVVSYVSSEHGSQIAAWSRFLIARLTAALSRGNTRTEFGERIYTGLFWHHLSEATVDQEIDEARLSAVKILRGKGAEPVFRILRPLTMEDAA